MTTGVDRQHAADVATFLQNYEFIKCREVNHPFVTRVNKWKVEGTGHSQIFTKTRECPQCGLKRIDRVSARRRPLKSLYQYPPGYKSDPGLNLSRPDIRLFELDRDLAELEPPAQSRATRKKSVSARVTTPKTHTRRAP
jgi:hypothetical protein